jgi:pilus assembly protein CpaD
MSAKGFMIGRNRDARAAIRIFAIALAASTLAGCYPATVPYTAVPAPTYPNDYRKRHPIALREGTRVVEVFIGSNRGALTPSQRADVLSFTQVWKGESTGGILIDVPSGTKNGFASSQAAREIRSIIAATGIPDNMVGVRPYQPDDPAKLAVVRMSYSKIVAEAGPCALWPDDLGPTYNLGHLENRPYWNLGCANQRNLAAMVANPADLVQPRGESPSWTARRTVVLEKYRAGQSPETIYPNADRGKVSDVAK